MLLKARNFEILLDLKCLFVAEFVVTLILKLRHLLCISIIGGKLINIFYKLYLCICTYVFSIKRRIKVNICLPEAISLILSRDVSTKLYKAGEFL
jgi:hypothetical protein